MYKASACAVLAVVSVLHPLHAQSVPSGDAWQQWLRDVDLLIAPKEREAFLALAGDDERRAFVERFWQVRDPFPETPRNELRERWASGLAEARNRWGTLDDDRSRVFLLQGEPASGFEARCQGIAGVLELWAYEPRFRVKHRSVIVFERPAQGPARIWQPAGGELPAAAACSGGERLVPELQWLKMVGAEHYRGSVERALLRPKPRQADWYTSLVALSPGTAAAPAGTAAPAAIFDGLQVDYPGQVAERRVVRVMMTVPPGSLRPPAPAAGSAGFQDLVLTGQVLRDREVLESFRYQFRVHPAAIEGQGIPLAFERYLLPGFYRLKVKLENLLSKSSIQGERELAVPGPQGGGRAARALAPLAPAAAQTGTPGTPGGSADVAGLYAEAATSPGEQEAGVHLFGPGDNLLIGNVRFEARIDEVPDLPEAERVDRVAFVLDGRHILTRNRPPYAVTLDLGPVPRSRTLRVEGLSRDGRVLAADEMALNAGAQRFAVNLVEPRPDRAYRRSLRARAEVEPPTGQTVERVEFYYNEDLVATLYQPPYSQPIVLPGQGAPAGYVRAVAYLAGGEVSSEDVVLLNTPESPDAMDVRLVELYTAVVDEAGRPVEGLGGSDFQVAEDGVRQSIRRVERVTDIPVRVVELIDNSGSMRGRMGDTRKAALGFLRRTLRPIDQAAVITFNQAPQVAVGFTHEMTALEEGFTGLVAEDYTSLYDSIAFALHYLTGVEGQRAILLLSDGEDRSSRFGYEQILEYARRSGITLYAIGLDLPEGKRGEAARKLERLAAETGGRSFFLTGTGELEAVYQEIERDLRSQYRITYQSSNTSTEDVFRAVDVQVAKAGLDARTISGYYP